MAASVPSLFFIRSNILSSFKHHPYVIIRVLHLPVLPSEFILIFHIPVNIRTEPFCSYPKYKYHILSNRAINSSISGAGTVSYVFLYAYCPSQEITINNWWVGEYIFSLEWNIVEFSLLTFFISDVNFYKWNLVTNSFFNLICLGGTMLISIDLT